MSWFRQMIEKVFIHFMFPAICHTHVLLTHLISTQMNDNQIDNWSDLDELKNAKSLETVYLERNPLQKDPQYRRKIMLALPSVRQIDATFIRFWGANIQFSCWLQCSLLPPCLPYLQKKKKEAYVILNTHPASQSCAVTPYTNTIPTRPQLIWHTCVLSLTPWSYLLDWKIAPKHLQQFFFLSFAICFCCFLFCCFACSWLK